MRLALLLAFLHSLEERWFFGSWNRVIGSRAVGLCKALWRASTLAHVIGTETTALLNGTCTPALSRSAESANQPETKAATTS